MDICDEYDHPDPELVYIVENIPYDPLSGEEQFVEFQSLEELCNSVLCNSCNCAGSGGCGSRETCRHGGNYQIIENYKNKPELILSKNRSGGDLIYECSQLCGCSRKCPNRVVQFGPRKGLQITTTAQKGRGLITIAPIREGAFVCEYAGEILSRSEAERRTTVNFSEGKMNYIVCLNESSNLNKTNSREDYRIQTFIDPSIKGNIGRYLNHSCDPNCETLSVRIDSPIPKIGIFAKRDIAAFEELCFHYGPGGFSGLDEKKPCHCGVKNCQQFLPAISF